MSKNSSSSKRILSLIFAFLIGIAISLGGAIIEQQSFFNLSLLPATAQSLRPEEAAKLVYERLSYLPLENQYLSQDTGQINPDNTLVSRFIRYHLYIKNRPSQFRLDWKLTLADYLGLNEVIKEDRYPGSSTLTQNPFIGDLEAIRSLNRQQRNELVATLITIFHPPSLSQPQATPTPTPTSTPSLPSLPQSGAADLLKL